MSFEDIHNILSIEYRNTSTYNENTDKFQIDEFIISTHNIQIYDRENRIYLIEAKIFEFLEEYVKCKNSGPSSAKFWNLTFYYHKPKNQVWIKQPFKINRLNSVYEEKIFFISHDDRYYFNKTSNPFIEIDENSSLSIPYFIYKIFGTNPPSEILFWDNPVVLG